MGNLKKHIYRKRCNIYLLEDEIGGRNIKPKFSIRKAQMLNRSSWSKVSETPTEDDNNSQSTQKVLIPNSN